MNISLQLVLKVIESKSSWGKNELKQALLEAMARDE